jgi:Uncharacterized conserved protein (DUF2304)
MSTGAKQALILAAGGGVLITIVLALARRRLMTTRYALGWLSIGLLTLLGASATGAVGEIGHVAGMTPTAVFLAVATVVLVAIALQLSISVSGLQSNVRELAETQAMLEDRLRELEPAEQR